MLQAMQAEGLSPPGELISDGIIHRFTPPTDRPGSEHGWYILFSGEPPVGRFGRWQGDDPCTREWCGVTNRKLTAEEKRDYAECMAEARRLQTEETVHLQAECSEWCTKAWAAAPPADPAHAYLVRKQVQPHGLRQYKDTLMVPCSISGRITGMQFISPDGSKKFKRNSVKQGACFLIGNITPTAVICEGFATGASIHEATGHTVLVAFDAGNLMAVAETARKRLPDADVIIAADNDAWVKIKNAEGNIHEYRPVPCEVDGKPRVNTGVVRAREAAEAVKCRVVAPRFRKLETHPTDFNDLHVLEGTDAVARAFAPESDEPPPPDDDDTPAFSEFPQPDPAEATALVTSGPSTIMLTHADKWPEPLSLPEGLPLVKKLDSATIPEPLRGWLMDIADRMQIPPDFSTAAAVVALGSNIGRGCGIHPKCQDDWLVIPNLWGGVIGRPSLMKTPAITEAQRHLVRLETEAREEYQNASQLQDANREVEKITRAAIGEELKKAVKNALKTGDNAAVEAVSAKLADLGNETPTTRRRYQTQDGTTEKIGELLNQNPRGILVNRDELIGWFHSLDKSGREGDRAFYLEAWNGTRGYTYDRIGRGTLDIEALCIAIFGAITPGPLSDYVYQTNRGGQGDDGLMQRFQVMVWPDVSDTWRNVDRFPDTVEKNRAGAIFCALADDIPGAVKEEEGDIPALRFSPAGQEVFDAWRHELETRLRSDHGLPPSLESHLAKYRSLMPSLALIFHLVEVADGATEPGPVSEMAAAMAAAWCDYLESHAGRIYGGALMPGMESAREIVKHIRRGAVLDGCKPKDIYRNHWARLATPEEVKVGLDVLIEYDWLTVNKENTGGRPSEIIRLNPLIKL